MVAPTSTNSISNFEGVVPDSRRRRRGLGPRVATGRLRIVAIAAVLLMCLSAGVFAGEAPDYGRSDAVLWTTLGLGALHHADHVLRANHSGFPFTSQVTTFTGTLAIYPFVVGGYLLDAGPLYWIVFDSLAFVGLALAHTVIEPPADQYDPWVDGSNLLGVESPALGRSAQVVSVSLSLSLAAHLVSSVVDGINYGFTWTRR